MREGGRIREELVRSASRLADAGVGNGVEEAEILLGEVLRLSRARVRLRDNEPLESETRERFHALLSRRLRREPLQHLVESWPFLELDLACDRRALVPRPETEDLALHARQRIAELEAPRVLDVGTGGGCVALALAAGHGGAEILATDISPGALEQARENARRTDFTERVRFAEGHLLDPVQGAPPFDLIVANLPYVAEAELHELEPEVRLFDPREALVAPESGLALIVELCESAPAHLTKGGWLLLEMAPLQTEPIRKRLSDNGFEATRVIADRYARPRIVEARWG